MTGAVGRLRDSLVSPIPGTGVDPPEARLRRRVVVVATLLLGAAALAVTLRIEPGDPTFYRAALGLAAIWAVGALASGPLRAGAVRSRGEARGPVVPALVLGLFALGCCLLGALLVARVPALREPVEDLLDHARSGSLAVVVAITVLNGIAEELFFRGALYSALRPAHAVATTTVVYALTTVGSGIPLLVLAAALLGLLTALVRRVTGGVLGPIVTHLTWSVGMLLLLPPVLDAAR